MISGVDKFQTESLLSLSKEDAVAAIQAQGFRPRMVREDHKMFIATRDYRLDRVNLEVEDGIVVNAYVG